MCVIATVAVTVAITVAATVAVTVAITVAATHCLLYIGRKWLDSLVKCTLGNF